MDKEHCGISIVEVQRWREISKSMPRHDAETVQRCLYQMITKNGKESEDVITVVDSISDRFEAEDRKMRRELLIEDMRRNGLLTQEHIDADDAQIVEAIKLTLPFFKNAFDWAGIYRILVDLCAFPENKAEFVRRFAQMGIYAKDDTVKGVDYRQLPAIKKEEYGSYQFSYQSIEKGIKSDWPPKWMNWKLSEMDDRAFKSRKNIAQIFLNELIIVTEKC